MIALGIGAAAFTAWVVLVFLRHRFWWTRERDHFDIPNEPIRWPSVTAVVPARDEAEVIARSIGSLVAQKYPGDFRIVLVDDNSSDGTAELALSAAQGSNRLTLLEGAPLAPGWTGKLWAVHQGIAAAGTPDFLWLTDADIAHAPDTLRALVTRAVRDDRVLV